MEGKLTTKRQKETPNIQNSKMDSKTKYYV